MVSNSCDERLDLFGSYSCRLDEKGRMKLPVDVLRYFSAETDKRVFVTSVTPGRASLYAMRSWLERLRVLRSLTENVAHAEVIERFANMNGAVTEVDTLGRVLVPIKLRQQFALEHESLALVPSGERLDIYRAADLGSVSAIDEAQLAEAITHIQGHGVRL